MEYHALHDYLKQNNFTKEDVIKFIELDTNDRTIYESSRDYAEMRYFTKYSLYELKYTDYPNTVNKYKYNYLK
jgi:hypothetical protein